MNSNDNTAIVRDTLGMVMIFSFSIQVFLVFLAPLRKQVPVVAGILSMPYYIAGGVANFALGVIFGSQQAAAGNKSNAPLALFALWAPFLLVHLGGQDTITAILLEDNQLWLRDLLRFLSQTSTIAHIIILTFSENKFWLPTLLLFLVGLIKYFERTRSLYLASSSRFREGFLSESRLGPNYANYAKLMNEYASKKRANLPTSIISFEVPPNRRTKIADQHQEDKNDLSDIEVIKRAHHFSQFSMDLIVDLVFSLPERNQSRSFFLNRTAKDAFKLVEVELNFLHDVLYTKILVIHNLLGYCLRFISFCSIVIALSLFALEDKNELHRDDIRTTYALFIGELLVEIAVFFMVISSDWIAVELTKSKNPSRVTRFFGKLLFVKRQRWVKDSSKPYPFHLKLVLPIFRRRWSEHIRGFNLIHYCLQHHPRGMMEKWIDFSDRAEFGEKNKYTRTERFNNGLRDFIFEELRIKSLLAEDLETAKEICLARGEWVLRINGCDALLPYVTDVNYDASLILWHIATDLCYCLDHEDNHNKEDFREFAKLLSDYMLRLLIIVPHTMSTVANIGRIRFRDTCAEAKNFFDRRNIGKHKKQNRRGRKRQMNDEHIEACKSILDVDNLFKTILVPEEESKSLLFDGTMLAKELIELEEKEKKDKWKIMSEVWVEFLCYAAYHSSVKSHVMLVAKGGHLITLVWLLMIHLGLGEQFQIDESCVRARLIVDK